MAVSVGDVFGKWITEQPKVAPEEVNVLMPLERAAQGWTSEEETTHHHHRHHQHKVALQSAACDEEANGVRNSKSKSLTKHDILHGVSQILDDKLAKHELAIEGLLAKQMSDLESAIDRDRKASQLWFSDLFKRFHSSMQLLFQSSSVAVAQDRRPSTTSNTKLPGRPIIKTTSNAGSSRGLEDAYPARHSDLSTYEVLGLSDEAILERISPDEVPRPTTPVSPATTVRNKSLRTEAQRVGKEEEREQLGLHVKRMQQKRKELSASGCGSTCCGINMEKEKSKKPKTLVEAFVDSSCFSCFFMIMIVLNTVFIAYHTNVSLSSIADFKEPPAGLQGINVGFLAVFTLEVVCRLVAYRKGFVARDDSGWNIFDLIIVVFGILEEALGVVNVQILRVLRVLRIFRVFRVIRVLRYTVGLRVYLLAVIDNIYVLFWACVGCLFVNFLVCLVILQGTLEYANDAKIISIQGQFGSVTRGMDTLIRSVLGGVLWGEVADTLEGVSPAFSVLLVVYIVFTILGMFNVVTGLFANSAAELRHHDRDLAMHHEMTLSNSMLSELSALLEEHVPKAPSGYGSASKDIHLSEFEFIEFVTTPEVQLYLQTHGIDSNEAIELFHLLDHNGQKITIEQFVFGCQRLKGLAKGMDVVLLFDQLHRLKDKVFEGKEWSKAGFNRMQKTMQDLQTGLLDLRNDLRDTTKMMGLTSPLGK